MNRENLKILADYLESLPGDYPHFDMGVFCRGADHLELLPREHECGSSMCAVGHGPRAGIPAIPSDTNWGRYAERVFEANWWDESMQFCFGGTWDMFFPNIHHAVARLRYVIANGDAPADFRHEDENHAEFEDL